MKLLWILLLLTLTQAVTLRKISVPIRRTFRHRVYGHLGDRRPLSHLDEDDAVPYFTRFEEPSSLSVQNVPGSAFTIETIPDIGELWESEINSIKKSSFPVHNVAPNGQSSQSRTKQRIPSRYVIDGWVSTCAMTEVEYEPWWTLDLRSNHMISFVAVTNRRDCCAEKLDGAEIHIGNNANWKENPRCGVVSSLGLGETFSFPCGGIQGRYVTIVIPNKNISLSLCEVQVFGHPHESLENETNTFKESESRLHGAPNVAQRGTASQSSDYAPATPATRAIDGSFSNNYPQCTHTNYDQDPWWTLDLQSKMRIFSVAITNRADCCEDRMNGVEVHIGDAKGDGKSNPRCAIIPTIAKGKTLAVNCHGMEGQFVSVVIEGRKEYLTLCEVQVFALPAEKKEEIKIFPELLPTKDPIDKQTTEEKKEAKTVDAVPVAKLTFKGTSQSSTDGKSVSGNAGDGKLENKLPDVQCAVTKKEYEPWWTASLGSKYIIHSVAVTSRGDCCTSDLDGAEIHVGYNKDDWKSNPICGSINSIGLGKTNLFKCNHIGGEYVTIAIPNKNVSLSLCEVQVFGVEVNRKILYCVGDADTEQQKNNHGAPNVAPEGEASQAAHSAYPDSKAILAIDGNLASSHYRKSCFHTNGVLEPWWTLDLKSKMRVSSVVITNRADCCAQRIKGAQIRIGDSEERDNPRCAQIYNLPFGDTFYFDCEGMAGRYVSVVIPGRTEFLHLCEVQVFAEPVESQSKRIEPKTDEAPSKSETGKGTTVSAKKLPLYKVSQSSTKGAGLARKAVDGLLTPQDPGSQCAVTEEQHEPWWRVEIQREHKIHSIAITSRRDCCSSHLDSAEIRIGNDDSDWTHHNICATVSSIGLGETVSFNCNWMVGKFVTIVMPNKTASLALCQVQVFGRRPEDVPTWNGDAEKKPDSHGFLNVAPHGLIFQSSYFDKQLLAAVTVDGNLATSYDLRSCTHTLQDQEPWWRVDMLSRMSVSSVAITNRGDCCAHRLDGAEIHIGNSEVQGGRNNPRCAKISSIGLGETLIFDCDRMEGRFVTIIIPGRKEYLQLCEVQVFADLLKETKDDMYHDVALQGVASQSSTFSSSGYARNANDGSLANNHILSQCSITQREPSPWWMVDLQSTYKVFAVVITNRVLECCKHRISGAEIRIGNSSEAGGTLNPRCGVITSMESGESLYFACNGMVGQYVTVTIPGRAENLILCEVQVFGVHDFSGGDISDVKQNEQRTPQGVPNLALSGLSSQSSLYNFFGESKNAIDGSLSSDYSQMQCSQTVEEINPWWTVDLKDVFMVLSVAVTNRQDGTWERLSNAEIRIGNSKDWIQNPRCAVIYSLGPGDTGMYNCNGMEGRYVTVLLPDKIEKLSLCEVQVFGLPLSSAGNIPSVTKGKGLDGASLIFSEEGNQTYAILQPREPIDLTEFTLCFSVSTALSGRREVILFSYCNNGADELNVWRELDGRLSLYLRSSSHGAIFSLPALSTFGTHICVTWQSSSGVTSFWVDGKRSTRQVYRKGHHVSPGGIVILGQDQDTCGGRFDVKQSFVGEISDIHLWNYVLPSSAFKDVYERKQSIRGNIIDWSSVYYSLHGNAAIQSMEV